jgi:ribosomal protein S18 acetylase RimI-like enzyme
MIFPAGPETFPRQFEQFQPAVRRLFPILGFSPEETERFIRDNSELYADTVFSVELAGGRRVFSRRCDGWDLVYLLPSHWPERYAIVEQAVREIQAAYLQARPASRLCLRIDEPVPSHSAYYAGMLPGLGFEMEPRVRMTASPGILDSGTPSPLPPEVREVRFTPERLPEFTELYLRAHAVHQGEWSPVRQRRFQAALHRELREAAALEDRVKTWFGLERDGALVGSCFGSTFRDRLFIDELAVLPDYCGMGWGRYLILRCLRELRDQYGKPASIFVLDCYRTYERALRLYRGLGFRASEWYTDATFWPEPERE